MLRFAYIAMSHLKKAQERVFLIPLSRQHESKECKLYLPKRMMEKRNEEGEEMACWKKAQGAAHISFSKQNVRFLFQLRSHLWVRATVRSGARFFFCFSSFFSLKCIEYLREERPVRAERGSKSETYGAHQHDINHTAKETLEKVQSKQTDPSHDSREIVGPHRSRPGCTDQPTGILFVGRLNTAPGLPQEVGPSQVCRVAQPCMCAIVFVCNSIKKKPLI